MHDTLMIMNFNNEMIGLITRDSERSVFIQTIGDVRKESVLLPRILSDIAPEPTQFPAANDVLEYFNMTKLDVWKYLGRSNGLKTSRDVWFMVEPPGEVWIPLIVGMQERNGYDALFRIGDKVEVLMNGRAYINRHTLDIFPECIKPYLIRREDTRFSTTTGYVKDLSPYPAVKGLIGRIVLNFP